VVRAITRVAHVITIQIIALPSSRTAIRAADVVLVVAAPGKAEAGVVAEAVEGAARWALTTVAMDARPIGTAIMAITAIRQRKLANSRTLVW
jgi:hypothetical protein